MIRSLFSILHQIKHSGKDKIIEHNKSDILLVRVFYFIKNHSNEQISWPIQGSFIDMGHCDSTGQRPSWGNIHSIDELIDLTRFSSFRHLIFSFRTILTNPIVNSTQSN